MLSLLHLCMIVKAVLCTLWVNMLCSSLLPFKSSCSVHKKAAESYFMYDSILSWNWFGQHLQPLKNHWALLKAGKNKNLLKKIQSTWQTRTSKEVKCMCSMCKASVTHTITQSYCENHTILQSIIHTKIVQLCQIWKQCRSFSRQIIWCKKIMQNVVWFIIILHLPYFLPYSTSNGLSWQWAHRPQI